MIKLIIPFLLILDVSNAFGQRFSMQVNIYENCNFIDTAKIYLFTKNEQKPTILNNKNKFIIIYDENNICDIDSIFIMYNDKEYKLKLNNSLLYSQFILEIKTDYISATEFYSNELSIINIDKLGKSGRKFKYRLDFYFSNNALPFSMYND